MKVVLLVSLFLLCGAVMTSTAKPVHAPPSRSDPKPILKYDDLLLTDLTLTIKPWGSKEDATCPEGTSKIDIDLNEGTGADELYFCKRRQPVNKLTSTPLQNILFHTTEYEKWTCPNGWENIGEGSFNPDGNRDMNSNAGGKFIYGCKKAAPIGTRRQILSDVKVTVGDPICEAPWSYTGGSQPHADLNEGAGGSRVYVCALYVADPRP